MLSSPCFQGHRHVGREGHLVQESESVHAAQTQQEDGKQDLATTTTTKKAHSFPPSELLPSVPPWDEAQKQPKRTDANPT